MKISRFSKPSAIAISAKQDFFSGNAELLQGALKLNALYAAQPRRERCKVCEAPIGGELFASFGVGYSQCRQCGHLNGLHEDTDVFVQFLYADDGGANYAEAYRKDFAARVENIYLPKVDFLTEVLAQTGVAQTFDLLDVGCGGGHFVRACEVRGVRADGVDPSATLTQLGAEALERNSVRQVGIGDFAREIEATERQVVSMIGVLEHLQAPHLALSAFANSAARYLYISVPLFSLSALLEHALPAVFPRQLSGAHTHLFTPESLDYLTERYGLQVLGEWWFGTDFVDLYRALQVSGARPAAEYKTAVDQRLGVALDELQGVLDRHRLASEVHLVLAKTA